MSLQATSNAQPVTSSTVDQEVLVKVEGVSKKFCRSLKRSLWYGVCDIAGELNPFAKQGAGSREQGVGGAASGGNDQLVTSDSRLVTSSPLRDGEFWAVNDVSFELRRGECLGLVGHNGAGKTTLLKMLNGLIKPDRGRIEIEGLVGALIALGAGFNPILTGRENIYINGAVLGMGRQEIDARLDAIIDFAGIGDFIDTPVQNYSSGMSVRLGFAVAANLIKPDVLILDEVLAVGDAAFRAKCLVRVSEMLANCAVIFVSHNEAHVSRICDRVLWLEHGRVREAGSPDVILPRYGEDRRGPEARTEIHRLDPGFNLSEPVAEREVRAGGDFRFSFFLSSERRCQVSGFRLALRSDRNEIVAQTGLPASLDLQPGRPLPVEGCLSGLQLRHGRYTVHLNVEADGGKIILLRAVDLFSFEMVSGFAGGAAYQPAGRIRAALRPSAAS